jgi:ubiquinone/menaquinone biosynthesis C-methylase UbiE
MELEPSRIQVFVHKAVMGTLGSRRYRRFVKGLDLKGTEHVLDFGSGWGVNAKFIAKELLKGNGRLTCLDVSRTWLEVAKRTLRNMPNVDFRLGDISEQNIPDDTYDVIVVHFVLHDIDNASRERTVKELARVLRSDGRLVLKDPLKMGHGNSVEGIHDVMNKAGLKEHETHMSKTWLFGETYNGVFVKGHS